MYSWLWLKAVSAKRSQPDGSDSAPLFGIYYQAPAPGAAPFVKMGDKVKELAKWERKPTSIDDIRKQAGAGYTDEELLLLVLVQEEDLKAMKEAEPPVTEFTSSNRPLTSYLRQVLKAKNVNQFSISRNGTSLSPRKAAQ